MTRPILLDLFCGAGGATKGYQRAGFYVVGVDSKPQPNYCGDAFVQGDALILGTELLASGRFSAVHASPPCQKFTAYRRKGHGVGDGYPNLIPPVREILLSSRMLYVIENVSQARCELVNPTMLCGSMFSLDVQRHRLFESNVIPETLRCSHGQWTPRFPMATNRVNLRRTVEVGVWRIPIETQRAAMGIDWMTLEELSQAIPPAYTEHIGRALLASLNRVVHTP